MAYKVELECTTNKSNFTSISHSTYLNLLDHESKLKLAHLPPALEISNVASSPRTTQNNSISPNIILMVLLLLFLFYSFQNFNCMRNTLYSPPSAPLVFSHHHYHRTASDFDAKSAFAVFYISIANLCANHRLRKSIVVMLLIASSSISLISAQNSSSYFDCQSDSQCNHDLYCIDGQDCDVICTGTDSCRYGAIHQPNTGNLTVYCSGTNACSSLAITGPINGSLILFCGGNYYSGCRATHAICPVFGECFVEVLSHYTTNDITVDARNMQSGGLYVSNAQRSIIQCPGNNLECIANCSDIACTGTSLHTQNDSILRVFASGVSSLQSVTVYCALNAICSVNVTEPASDPLSHFKLYSIDALDGVSFLCDYMTDASECYSLNYPPQLWCKSEYDTGCSLEYNAMNQWQCTNNMSVSELCTNNETLPGYYGSQIVCQYNDECTYDMYCIDGQNCDVTCAGWRSCKSGVIHQPVTGNLSVTCSTENSCRDMTIAAPINGSFALSCAGAHYSSACNGIYAICPIYGDCSVEVSSWHSSNIMTVDASNMTSGHLFVSAIQRSIVHCPGNSLECIADCSDIACTGTSFHTKNGSILRVFASAVSSLKYVNVFCALDANCSINVTQPISDSLSHFKLYSIDALDGVSFTCDYVSDISECYDYKDPPQIWCKSEYNTGCSLEYNAANQWQCTNNMSVSELCTNNETLPGYYGSQIVCQYNDECTYDMYCIDGQNCDVTCAGWRSCESGVIHQPDTGNLSVTCSTEHSCRDMTITAPINGSLALSCAGAHSDSACNGIYAICPIYGDCSVQVSSWHGLNDMTVDASNMTSGHLFVSAIQKSIIKCPGNQLECIADCVDVSCTGTSFHARNDSILRVSASGVSSLQSVNLYCAANANCSIVVDCGAQRSAICDIESQTGTAYDQWQCNTKSSKYPIVNFTDICRTHDPTIDPTIDPTTDPTIDPSHPTANPSADLYTTPLSSWGETSITIVCACYFDEDKIDTINDIIIAYLDDDARIVGTKITTHAVSVIVAHADSNTLDHDMISRDIEVKLKDQYDVDVDVTFDDTDDDEHQKRKPNIIQFLLAHVSKDVVIGLMIGFLLFVFVFIIGCICFCFHKRVKKRVKMQEVMMAKQQMDTQTGKEPNDTRTKEHAQDISMDVVPGGNDDGHDTDDSLYAVEDDGERGNVNDLTLGNTQTRKEPTDTTNAHDWNDDENDTDESLYDAGEEDGKGGITIGNTIA